ncbi:MAG TPA: hypothetical protein VLX92_04495 [Kofleriaceae bacterium]|nr:hypothetical protein [Kofleriaceae bacterium]
MTRLVLAVLVGLTACGSVNKLKAGQGSACATDGDCVSGACSDGVCCDRACGGTCESCVAADTGGTDGTCAAVKAGTDAASECPASDPDTCGANGTGCNGNAGAPACNVYPAEASCGTHCDASGVVAMTCDGAGSCRPSGTPTACGYFACDAQGDACTTSCATASDCAADGACAGGTCIKKLRVALETGVNSCLLATGQVIPQVQAALVARGHAVTIVSGADLATAAQIAAYDVIVLDDPGNSCDNRDWAMFDGVIAPYITGGGGIVATGWVLFNGPDPNLATVLPGSGSSYLTGTQQLTPTGSHPISAGLHPFDGAPSYTPYGGTVNPGATVFLVNGASSIGYAWTHGSGRAVYLGPIYMGYFPTYMNQALSDGTEPDALEMLLRAIEWAGQAR